ncbi:MAG TPA: PAS domain S-box protein [Cyanobacteria bacterium UBA8553]|nr:PAS domain S-box protein [Cyanobacteria bacterium UBA8553]
MVQHLEAIGAGIWTVDPAAVGESEVLPLDLQASAGNLIPSDIFPDRVLPNHELIGAIAQTKHSVSTQLPATSEDLNLQTFFSGYPLILESRLVGVIGLLSRQPLSEIIDGVLDWVANAIALAIDRSWARDELLTRREALLFRLASQIRNSLDLDTILNTAVTEIRTLLKVDCCHFLWCWSEPNQPDVSVTHEACECDQPSLLGESPPPHLAPLAQTICSLQPLRIDDVAQSPDLDTQTRDILNHLGVISGLVLPLKTQTGQLGAIVCSNYNGPHLWSDREVELLQAVVDQLAIAIEHAELFATTRATALAAQTQARQLELALHDLQKTEARLIQTEKMSSLGQMVAGIAHEINNPVCFITGNLSHATNYIQDLLDLIVRYEQHYSNPAPELQDYIEKIDLNFLIEDLPKILSSMKMGADRIHEIVVSLRNFSRLDDTEMKPVNIHEGIDSTLLILHNRLKPIGPNPGIQVIKEYGNLPPVDCYSGQLNQVFMNIISNAIDALQTQPEPRNITIRTEVVNKKATNNELSENPLAQTPESVEAGEVIIRISDNGPGMTQSIVQHLFDPFFTTKPVGKGTGLGLSISHQIVVEKHGGILKCISEPGQGSEFWIQIPIASKAASVAK